MTDRRLVVLALLTASALALASAPLLMPASYSWVAHTAFGSLMICAAVFSSRPWQDGARYHEIEDLLHSVAASTMGVAFGLGVVATTVARRPEGVGILGPVSAAASVAIPVAMTVWDDAAGLLQRTMFAIAYAWYATETVAAGPNSSQ